MNEQLISYIKEQTALGVSKETIIQNLKNNGGWSEADILPLLTDSQESKYKKYAICNLLLTSTFFPLIAYLFFYSFRSPENGVGIPALALFSIPPSFFLAFIFIKQCILFRKQKYIRSFRSFSSVVFPLYGIYFISFMPYVLETLTRTLGVIPSPTLGYIIIVGFPVTILAFIFFSFYLNKKKKYNTLFVFQLVYALVTILFLLYPVYDAYRSRNRPLPGTNIPCITGQYNPSTKVCE